MLVFVIGKYNSMAKDKICVTIYLTNDGCTDGTAEAIKAVYPKRV